jgi:hypothetical protein
MRATVSWTTRDGQVIRQPDWRQRRRAAETILDYLYGKPVERIISHTSSDRVSVRELKAHARQSPALANAMQQIVALDKLAGRPDVDGHGTGVQ